MKMLARADCFVGSTFHKAGEVFEYDGQPGNAFVRADDDNPPPLITDQQRIDSMLGIKSSQPGSDAKRTDGLSLYEGKANANNNNRRRRN